MLQPQATSVLWLWQALVCSQLLCTWISLLAIVSNEQAGQVYSAESGLLTWAVCPKYSRRQK